MMIGLFSVNEGIPGKVNRDGKCYIALSLSCDGVHWSRFTPLMKTEGERGRTFDQPVSGSCGAARSCSFSFSVMCLRSRMQRPRPVDSSGTHSTRTSSCT